jgi:hypothetical protein
VKDPQQSGGGCLAPEEAVARENPAGLFRSRGLHEVATELGHGPDVVQHKPPTVQAEQAVRPGDQFLETQCLGEHGFSHCIME